MSNPGVLQDSESRGSAPTFGGITISIYVPQNHRYYTLPDCPNRFLFASRFHFILKALGMLIPSIYTSVLWARHGGDKLNSPDVLQKSSLAFTALRRSTEKSATLGSLVAQGWTLCVTFLSQGTVSASIFGDWIT